MSGDQDTQVQSEAAARHAIENLLYDYAALADQLDASGIGALLSQATLRSTAGVEVAGSAAIEEHLGGLFQTAQRSRHMMTNVRVTLSEDGASATSICLYNKWVINDAPVLDACGRYHSAFVLENGAWRFREHLIENQFRAK